MIIYTSHYSKYIDIIFDDNLSPLTTPLTPLTPNLQTPICLFNKKQETELSLTRKLTKIQEK